MSDENEESNEEGPAHTTLVHVENAAEKVSRTLQKYDRGELSQEDLEREINDAKPGMSDIGVEYAEDEGRITLNTKAPPEHFDSAVYFYRDDDGTFKMTCYIPRLPDNYPVDDGERAEAGEYLAFDVLRLINSEHNDLVRSVLMQSQLSELLGNLGGEEDESEDDSSLSEIEDPDTRAKVREAMRKH